MLFFYTFTLQQSVGLRNVIMEVPGHTHACVVCFVVVVVFPLFTETKVQAWDHFYRNLENFRSQSNSTHETQYQTLLLCSKLGPFLKRVFDCLPHNCNLETFSFKLLSQITSF